MVVMGHPVNLWWKGRDFTFTGVVLGPTGSGHITIIEFFPVMYLTLSVEAPIRFRYRHWSSLKRPLPLDRIREGFYMPNRVYTYTQR
jgi:hypothetical protein